MASFKQTKQTSNNLANTTFNNNILGADLAEMQLISKHDRGLRFLLCVIDLYCKYAWVVPLKDKKGDSVGNIF